MQLILHARGAFPIVCITETGHDPSLVKSDKTEVSLVILSSSLCAHVEECTQGQWKKFFHNNGRAVYEAILPSPSIEMGKEQNIYTGDTFCEAWFDPGRSFFDWLLILVQPPRPAAVLERFYNLIEDDIVWSVRSCK